MPAGALHIEAVSPESICDKVYAGLDAHIAALSAPPYTEEHYALSLSEGEGDACGGLVGRFLWDWLEIKYLWVDESQRGRGCGRRLMESAEQEARRRGCAGLFVWTQSWQAPGFYEKLGFSRCAELPDFPRGYQRVGLLKKLSGQGA